MDTKKNAILFKDEGPGGPVRIRRDGVVSNYEDHPALVSPISGKPSPQWFSRKQAQAIAKREGLPFEES